jgi:hypothetical protein
VWGVVVAVLQPTLRVVVVASTPTLTPPIAAVAALRVAWVSSVSLARAEDVSL